MSILFAGNPALVGAFEMFFVSGLLVVVAFSTWCAYRSNSMAMCTCAIGLALLLSVYIQPWRYFIPLNDDIRRDADLLQFVTLCRRFATLWMMVLTLTLGSIPYIYLRRKRTAD